MVIHSILRALSSLTLLRHSPFLVALFNIFNNNDLVKLKNIYICSIIIKQNKKKRSSGACPLHVVSTLHATFWLMSSPISKLNDLFEQKNSIMEKWFARTKTNSKIYAQYCQQETIHQPLNLSASSVDIDKLLASRRWRLEIEKAESVNMLKLSLTEENSCAQTSQHTFGLALIVCRLVSAEGLWTDSADVFTS